MALEMSGIFFVGTERFHGGESVKSSFAILDRGLSALVRRERHTLEGAANVTQASA